MYQTKLIFLVHLPLFLLFVPFLTSGYLQSQFCLFQFRAFSPIPAFTTTQLAI